MSVDSLNPINTNPAVVAKPPEKSGGKDDSPTFLGNLFSIFTSLLKTIFSPILGIFALCKLGGEPYPPVTKTEATSSNTTPKTPSPITAPPIPGTNSPVANRGIGNGNPATPTYTPSNETTPQKTQAPKGATKIVDKKPNERFFYFGDSQAGALHGNHGGKGRQTIFQENNNGYTRIGAGPQEISIQLDLFLRNPANIASLRGKTLVLSPGADNTNADSTGAYSQMAALLREKNIPYIIIPPGHANAKNKHLESLKTAFRENNVLDTKGVAVAQSDKTHYYPNQLQQAIDTQYPHIA